MRRHLLPASFLLLVIGLAGCAHQSAGGGGGYAGTAFGDCEFGEDCYGPGANGAYTCVFFEAPAMPARLAITGTGRHHPFPRNVEDRNWTPGSPPVDSSVGVGSYSAPASAPVMREPVVVASPSGDRVPAPRSPN